MSADIFYQGFFLLSSSFFFRCLISELAEQNSTTIGHMVSEVSAIWIRVSEMRGIPSAYKLGAQKPPFWTTSQLDGKFNGLYLRNGTWYRQSVKCVDDYEGSPTRSPNIMNFGPQTASNSTCILPPSTNSAFHFIVTLRRRRSANGSRPNVAKRWTVGALTMCRREIGVVRPEKNCGQRTFTFVQFSTTSRLNSEYLLNETWHRQSGKGVGKPNVLLRCPKISWTLVHKRLKTEPDFLPTITILFCVSPSHALYPASAGLPIATLNEAALDSSAAYIWGLECYRVGRP